MRRERGGEGGGGGLCDERGDELKCRVHINVGVVYSRGTAHRTGESLWSVLRDWRELVCCMSCFKK